MLPLKAEPHLYMVVAARPWHDRVGLSLPVLHGAGPTQCKTGQASGLPHPLQGMRRQHSVGDGGSLLWKAAGPGLLDIFPPPFMEGAESLSPAGWEVLTLAVGKSSATPEAPRNGEKVEEKCDHIDLTLALTAISVHSL